MSPFGLFFTGRWAVAVGALVYAAGVLVRARPEDWVRRRGRPAARLLVPAPAYLPFDGVLAGATLLADPWLVSTAVVSGSDGIFTEDWTGYGGTMERTAVGGVVDRVVRDLLQLARAVVERDDDRALAIT